MSYRDKFRKVGGGGFLNNVDGVINSVTFSLKDPTGEPGDALWAVFNITEDGKEPITQHFKVAGTGGKTNWVISRDKKTAVSKNDDAVIWATDDGLSQLLASMIDDAHMDEADFPDPSRAADLNFEFLEGQRFRFIQVKRTDEWALANPRKDKKPGSKKTYARTYTAVSAKLGSSNGNGPDSEDDTTSLSDEQREELAEALVGILRKAKKPVALKDLKLKVTSAFMSYGPAEREPYVSAALDPETYESIDNIDYDSDANTIALA